MGKFFCCKAERPEAKPEKFVNHAPEHRKKGIEQGMQQEKIGRHTHCASRQQKQPQIPAADIQPHSDQTEKSSEQKKQIRQCSEPGDAPAQGPQKIVKQTKDDAQSRRQRKPQKLAGNRRSHQRNSLARKPPSLRGSS